MTVNETENGNFLIAWDTNYRTDDRIFSDDLITELTYYIEGSKGTRKNVSELYVSSHNSKKVNNWTLHLQGFFCFFIQVIVSAKGRFEYELIGRNLEPNSNYIVMARIQSLLNDRFSDYSDPYRFSTRKSFFISIKNTIPFTKKTNNRPYHILLCPQPHL